MLTLLLFLGFTRLLFNAFVSKSKLMSSLLFLQHLDLLLSPFQFVFYLHIFWCQLAQRHPNMISFISISFFSCSAVLFFSSTIFFCDYKYFLCLLLVIFLSFIFQCTISSLLLWKFPHEKFVDSYLISFLHLLYCQYFVLNLHFCFSFPFHFFRCF